MKKIFWAAPLLVVVAALVLLLIVQNREIDPAEQVFPASAAELTELSESGALALFENNREAFVSACEGGALPEGVLRSEAGRGVQRFILDEKFGSYTQYIAFGDAGAAADPLGAEGYNRFAYRRAISDGWVYCVDGIRAITFEDTYVKRVKAVLSDAELALLALDEGAELTLADKNTAPSPAERCETAYVVTVRFRTTSGGFLTAVLDAKNKALIGFAE